MWVDGWSGVGYSVKEKGRWTISELNTVSNGYQAASLVNTKC